MGAGWQKSSFEASATIGAWAVRKIEEELIGRGAHVENVEDDPFFQSLDVDLLLHRRGRNPLLVEVKGDTYTTGNLYIETISNTRLDSPGCMIYTAADYLAYYFVRAGTALWIPTKKLQEWIPENINRFPKHNPVTTRNAKVVSNGEGHTVPVGVLLKEVSGIKQMHFLPEME